MNHLSEHLQFLRETIDKQLELCATDSFWSREIPARCPPVLWFGEAMSQNRPILTMSANPSRQEFLARQWGKTQYEKSNVLKYMEQPRFYVFDSDLQSQDVTIRSLQAVIESYQQYFSRPDNAYDYFRPIEVFLNAMNASYYGKPNHRRALHIDLIPFVTLSDFRNVESHIAISLFRDGWGQRHFHRLVRALNPTSIAIFGEGNVEFFNRWFDVQPKERRKILLEPESDDGSSNLEVPIQLVSIHQSDVPILQIGKYMGGVRNKFSDLQISLLGKRCSQFVR